MLKDTIDVEGMPTTGGFAPMAESYPVRDAAVTKKLRAAEDIAYAVSFFALEAAQYVTGQTLHVSSGMFTP